MDKKKRKRNIKYVDLNIDELTIEDRAKVLNMIVIEGQNQIFYEENTGCRCRYSEIRDDILEMVVDFVKIAKQKNMLHPE